MGVSQYDIPLTGPIYGLRLNFMDKSATVELKGKAGNWVALKGDSYQVVAEGRTLREVAGKARRLGIKNPTFARIPRKDCALIL